GLQPRPVSSLSRPGRRAGAAHVNGAGYISNCVAASGTARNAETAREVASATEEALHSLPPQPPPAIVKPAREVASATEEALHSLILLFGRQRHAWVQIVPYGRERHAWGRPCRATRPSRFVFRSFAPFQNFERKSAPRNGSDSHLI